MLTLNVELEDLVKELVEIDYEYCKPPVEPQWIGGEEVTDILGKYCLTHDQTYFYCKKFQKDKESEILEVLERHSKI